MRLRTLKKGTKISSKITIDSVLESHRGIATYLASHTDIGHILIHILPDYEENGVPPINYLKRAVEFYHSINIPAECGKYEDILYFCESFPLGEYMFEWLERREHVERSEAIKRIISVLRMLTSAHKRGIFHGRITPKSVLMERTSETFGIRIMGLGVAQAMPKNMQLDIDWFDYSFDLEGMDEVAVDIYGLAIVLMGLVCGESGIDSFEASGLLPAQFREGRLQLAMERALSLQVESYSSLLAFSQDLEAALLEIDGKEGEMYVGDLVGFESALRSVTSISAVPGEKLSESGVWSTLVDHLEINEKNSLLCSLTSLTAIPAVPPPEEEDNDVTHITAMPDPVLMMRRIHSKHISEATDNENRIKQIRAEKNGGLDEEASTNRTKAQQNEAEANPPAPDSSNNKTIELEAPAVESTVIEPSPLLKNQPFTSDVDEEEAGDESPTRVMMRPNYISITTEAVKDSTALDHQTTENTVETRMEDVIQPQDDWKKRILNQSIVEADNEVKSDVTYPEDPVPSPVPQNTNQELPPDNSKTQKVVVPTAPTALKVTKNSKNNINKQIIIICILVLIIILLIILFMQN